MRNCIDTKNLRLQLKAGLQVCHKVLNKDKHSEKKYKLLNDLAELYLQKENIRDYPKMAAIYQYLKKLVEKHLKGNKGKLALLDQRIKSVEASFLEKVRVLSPDIKGREQEKDGSQEIKDIIAYKEELAKFREGIKKELPSIEDLGIEKDKEELNEEGLQKRAQEVEEIYMEIREFFIGKRDEAGELIESGLINKLINDCIKQLGGLPKVGRDNHECEYAIFGMGSMALGTMTPWSDLEFGVLIEEGLGKEEEERVKEYFRNLTSLLHIKVVNFGETPLRMMGIKELNIFKLTDKSNGEYNWFYDDLTKSGFSFDGPHWHACKTPLGRVKCYQKAIMKEGAERYVQCSGYELIGTVNEFMAFYQKDNEWHEQDPNLVQSLGHIALIDGSNQLIISYYEKLEVYMSLIRLLAFKILKKDNRKLNPLNPILDEDKEGQVLKVKKEIYRFPDRVIVALGDSLGGKGASSWELIENTAKIGDKQKQSLHLVLSIATEIRLRTYASNDGQVEDMSAIVRYESRIEELRNDASTEVFYLKDMRMLYKYYSAVLELNIKISRVSNRQSLEEINRILMTGTQSVLIKGYMYKRFLRYDDAIREFESIDVNNSIYIMSKLAHLYYIVGQIQKALELYKKLKSVATDRAGIATFLGSIGVTLDDLGQFDEALKCYQESFEIIRKIYKGDHTDIAASLNNIGTTLNNLDRFNRALKYYKKSLEINRRIYKGDHPDIAGCVNNIGVVLERLDRFDEALKCHQESLEMRRRIYKGNHPDIATSLNNIGNTLEKLARFDKALKYYLESLGMRRRIYKGDHSDIAASLNNIGTTLQRLNRFDEALKAIQESLGIMRRICKGDHTTIVASLNNIGTTLQRLNRFDEALEYHKESLEIMRRIYKGDHTSIAASLNNIGVILDNLGRFDEALKYRQESLEIRERIFKGDHVSIAASLNNIGITLQSLGRFDEALQCALRSVSMFQGILPLGHPYIQTAQEQFLNCTVLLANQEILMSNYDKALKHYSTIATNSTSLKDVVHSLASQFWRVGKLNLTISCYEALSKKLMPEDRSIEHNLACVYHIKALEAKNKGREEDYQRYLSKAKETFEKALNIDSNEEIRSSLYVEYAQFLIKHHGKNNLEEHKKIIELLTKAIAMGDDSSGLSYNGLEKVTTVEVIQELLDSQEEAQIKPYLLAYYLKVRIHAVHDEIEEAQSTIEEFKAIAMSLQDTNDRRLAQHFLNHAYKIVHGLRDKKAIAESSEIGDKEKRLQERPLRDGLVVAKFKEGIEGIDTLISNKEYEKALEGINQHLKLCYESDNKGKYILEEYELLMRLGNIYLHADVYDIPKAAATYQYLKKLIEKHLNNDPEKVKEVEARIQNVESVFLARTKVQKADSKAREEDATEVIKYKDKLLKFREVVKEKLTKIKDSGVEKGKEELNEEGLKERAQTVKVIHEEIREFFIGKRSGAGELTQPGLVNGLISDCIRELGGLPRVGADKHECAYAVFGMGSMALGTMTPWSDLEFGILIEERLSSEEETKIKEYFRLLTTLLHIKVINFGETPLRMMGIKELNNFRITDKPDPEHNWFFDDLTSSGFSFDGPHSHARKTPLGRSGYHGCEDFSLICTATELTSFQQAKWYKSDAELSQALGYITLISGDDKLLSDYFEKVKVYQGIIQQKAVEIINSDSSRYNPSVLFEAAVDGKMLDIKKDVYRFPDRMLAGLGHCILGMYPYKDAWNLLWVFKSQDIVSEGTYVNLSIMLGLASELRLRNYIDNEGQEARLFLKQSENFAFKKYNSLLNAFFFRSFSLYQKLTDITSHEAVTSLLKHYNFVFDNINILHIKGLVNQKFLRYTEAEAQYSQLMELYQTDKSNIDLTPDLKIIVIQTLFSLGHIYYRRDMIDKAIGSYTQAKGLIGENKPYLELVYHNCMGNIHFKRESYDEALLVYEIALKNTQSLFGEKSVKYGIILSNIANTFFRKNRFEHAGRTYLKALEVFKNNDTYAASCLVNLGNVYLRQNKFSEALSRYKESLAIKEKILNYNHHTTAGVLLNIGNCYRFMKQPQNAITFYNKAIWIYENGFVDEQLHYSAALNNIACVYRDIDKYDIAIKYCLKALAIKERTLGKDSLDYAISLNLLGDLYVSTKEYDKAEGYLLQSLDIKRSKKDNLEIAHTKKSLAVFYFRTMQLEKSLVYATECYSLYIQYLNSSHSLTQNTRMLILQESKILIAQNNQSNLFKALRYLNGLIDAKPTDQELQTIGLNREILISNLQFVSGIISNFNTMINIVAPISQALRSPSPILAQQHNFQRLPKKLIAYILTFLPEASTLHVNVIHNLVEKLTISKVITFKEKELLLQLPEQSELIASKVREM